MSYNANIPQASDIPSQSQAQLLANFQQIANAFNTNHVDFNQTGQGKHDFLQMPVQSVAPATAVGEGGLYTKTVSALAQLFYRNENNGTEVQITGNSITSAANGGTAGGIIYTWDLFGLRVYFGTTGAFSANVTRTVVFPTPYTTIYMSLSTANDPSPRSVGATRTTTTLSLTVSDGVAGVDFLVLGVV